MFVIFLGRFARLAESRMSGMVLAQSSGLAGMMSRGGVATFASSLVILRSGVSAVVAAEVVDKFC